MSARYELTYQGQPGAFSEDAAFDFVGPEARLLPSRTLPDTFDGVSRGEARFAIVPVENTLAGPIDEAYDLLAGSRLAIVDETVQPISHCLIGPKGARTQEVRRVLSHPIALAQCAGFLRSHPEWEAVRAFDTAGAVEDVLREKKPGDTAIGSARSAAVYGGEILLEGIQDHPENYTRFLLLAADSADGTPRASDQTTRKTSICFRISDTARRESGVLRPFVECGVPLASVLSRPVASADDGESVYHLDFIGSIESPAVGRALDRIRKGARDLKVLGSYPLRVASIREVVRPARPS